MNKINKYEFIECIIPQSSSNTRFFFADQPQLRFVSLNALECYNISTVPVSILSGNANIDQTTFLSGFLVLYYDDKEATNRIPLTLLNPVGSNVAPATTTGTPTYNFPSVFGVKTYNGQQVQWSKSYVQFTSAPNPAAINSVCFGVYYS
jgi:hypothetical protein